jgi:hypothetical protein
MFSVAVLSTNTLAGRSHAQSCAVSVLIVFHYLSVFMLLTFVMLEK